MKDLNKIYAKQIEDKKNKILSLKAQIEKEEKELVALEDTYFEYQMSQVADLIKEKNVSIDSVKQFITQS